MSGATPSIPAQHIAIANLLDQNFEIEFNQGLEIIRAGRFGQDNGGQVYARLALLVTHARMPLRYRKLLVLDTPHAVQCPLEQIPEILPLLRPIFEENEIYRMIARCPFITLFSVRELRKRRLVLRYLCRTATAFRRMLLARPQLLLFPTTYLIERCGNVYWANNVGDFWKQILGKSKPAPITEDQRLQQEMFDNLRVKEVAPAGAEKIARRFTRYYGANGMSVFKQFEAHGWTAQEILVLRCEGHDWRKDPIGFLDLQDELEKFGFLRSIAKSLLIERPFIHQVDRRVLFPAIETLRKLGFDDPGIHELAKQKPILFRMTPEQVREQYQKSQQRCTGPLWRPDLKIPSVPPPASATIPSRKQSAWSDGEEDEESEDLSAHTDAENPLGRNWPLIVRHIFQQEHETHAEKRFEKFCEKHPWLVDRSSAQIEALNLLANWIPIGQHVNNTPEIRRAFYVQIFTNTRYLALLDLPDGVLVFRLYVLRNIFSVDPAKDPDTLCQAWEAIRHPDDEESDDFIKEAVIRRKIAEIHFRKNHAEAHNCEIDDEDVIQAILSRTRQEFFENLNIMIPHEDEFDRLNRRRRIHELISRRK